MCTVVILRRPGHDWPLLFAANRDEMTGRPWSPPGRHWPDRANVTAGIDRLAGGTWLGLNDEGVIAGVLNRPGSLGPDPDLRSRGELPLETLDHASAADAADALAHLEPASYRSFNLIVADARQAFWICSRSEDGKAPIEVATIPDGLSMITASDMNDETSARIRRFKPRFEAAPTPDPATGDWVAWKTLMASPDTGGEAAPEAAMTIITETGFGTVSSSLIALPDPMAAAMGSGAKPLWLFAPERPDTTDYEPVGL